MNHELSNLAAQVRALIRSSPAESPPAFSESAFDALALSLFRAQMAQNAAYRAICLARGIAAESVTHWRQIPAVPARAFKELELTALAPEDRTMAFCSSGTTGEVRSQHFHSGESVALYEESLWAWFHSQVIAGRPLLRPVALTPSPASAPNSSLVHMFGEISRRLGCGHANSFAGTVGADGAWEVDLEILQGLVRPAIARSEPLLLFGTAFNWVHLLDVLAASGTHLRLPAGSVVLETGGYKGRSRELSRSELHAALTATFGVAAEQVVTEYGMSELSSQAYAFPGAGHGRQWFRFPVWARAQVVSMEHGREVPDGAAGVLRILDLANVWSVCALQTEDLAVRHGDAFELLGRVPAAEPRGCSRMTA